jgi:hypothetical protein
MAYVKQDADEFKVKLTEWETANTEPVIDMVEDGEDGGSGSSSSDSSSEDEEDSDSAGIVETLLDDFRDEEEEEVVEEEAAPKAVAKAAPKAGGGAAGGAGAAAPPPPNPLKGTPKPVRKQLDALPFWRLMKASKKLPLLSWLARSFLGIGISAAEVERLFSKCGLVMTARRNRLGARKEELYLLAAYTATTEWREAKKLGDAEPSRRAMRHVFGDDLDFDDDGEESSDDETDVLLALAGAGAAAAGPGAASGAVSGGGGGGGGGGGEDL